MAHVKSKHGRVGRVSEEIQGYYRRVQDTLNRGFDNDTENEFTEQGIWGFLEPYWVPPFIARWPMATDTPPRHC